MEIRDDEMRLPEEGPPTGAGPGTGVIASGQRLGDSEQPGRGYPETQPTSYNIRQRAVSIIGPPTNSASHAHDIGTTAVGLPRRRIKWTLEMNASVIKAFFKARRNPNIGSNYRQHMYETFIQDYPYLHYLTEQNLADRRAAIVRNNLLPPAIIEEIRQAVINEESEPNTANMRTPTNSHDSQPVNRPTVQRSTDNAEGGDGSTEISPEQGDIDSIQSNDILGNIACIFQAAKIKFSEMDAGHRPFLPKVKPNGEIIKTIKTLNEDILPHEITTINNNYDKLIDILYCSVHTILETEKIIKSSENSNRITRRGSNMNRSGIQNPEVIGAIHTNRPKWQTRILERIEDIRKDLGFVLSVKNNGLIKRKEGKMKRIKRKHLIHTRFDPPNATIDQILDTIKQKLIKYTDRYRKYTKSYKRRNHNNIFRKNEKQFYNTLKPTANSGSPLDITQIKQFWNTIWGTESQHNPNAAWINSIQESAANIPVMSIDKIAPENFKKAIEKLQNWKHPGPDKIHNFYYKYLTALHQPLVDIFNAFIETPALIPATFSNGITYLKPKINNPTLAAQYRPITCLNTGYKLFTSCLTILIGEHCRANNIMAEQQKGCSPGTKGCKDQLILDSIVTCQAVKNRKNMFAAFIDYQKAFDSIPHSWLIYILQLYKINPKIIHCLQETFKTWATRLHMKVNNSDVMSDTISIKRGIYQGDSLSPLLFCLGLNPLSTLLNQSGYGYRLKATDNIRISHSLYMDDLKIYANNLENLKKLLYIIEIFSNDIGMHFGVNKCKTQNIKRGKLSASGDFATTEGELIQALRSGETYKYLGIQQAARIDHTAQKKLITAEFTRRLQSICNTGLNSRNLAKAINTYAIPLLIYTFGIIAWSKTDLHSLETKIRSTLTKYRYHHPQAAIERINIPRSQGGRGILSIYILHNRQITSLRTYFLKTSETSEIYRALVAADKNLTPLNMGEAMVPVVTTSLVERWKSKSIHGKYPNAISQDHIDMEHTTNWLKYGNLFPETEGFLIAIQDGVVCTRNYAKYILKDPSVNDDKCRMCASGPETIAHILNGCTPLAASRYKDRHDVMGKVLYISLIKKLKIKTCTGPYYKFQPEPIIETLQYTLYWDRSIIMNTPSNTTVSNRPDLTLIDKGKKEAFIIDFAIPLDSNIMETINTKIAKYQQLAQYMTSTRNLRKVEILPIIISSTGIVPKRTVESIKTLDLNLKILTDMQKAILIKTASIVREFIG